MTKPLKAWLPDEWDAMAAKAMERIPEDKREALRKVTRHLRGKGWDESSIVLGFAIACGLGLDEALALAGDTRFPLLGGKKGS